jgi:hypothetical protein
VLDLDYEDFFVVAHEDGAAAIGREDSPNLDWHDVVLHTDSLLRELKKTSTAKGEAGRAVPARRDDAVTGKSEQ